MAPLLSNVAQFTFEISAVERDLRVVQLAGSEELSRPFSFTLQLACTDEIEFQDAVGKPARLIMYSEYGGIARYVNGLVSWFEHVGESGRFTLYQTELVPHLWLLTLRHRSRIFQHKSVQEIITQLLREAGMTTEQYRFVLQNTYAPREYCVQYQESDFHFVSRLMEEEGIFYFFEHTATQHILVMADGSAVHTAITAPSPVLFRDASGLVTTEESIFQFRYTETMRPGAVMLQDFDFTRPSFNLQAKAQSERNTALEIYEYPGEYLTSDRGRQLARVRLEAVQASGKVGEGGSVCRQFLPGYQFTLAQHPRLAFNQKYTLIRVMHTASQPQVLEEQSSETGNAYNNSFACIPASVPFRPTRVTPRPVIYGSQTALVVGPDGEEIYTNEHGQVKVQFHWDREGTYDEKSSCWLRVSQGLAGAAWGSIYLPRIGQEVIVTFLEGDPDRPLITGRVYNGESPPPYPLPAEKTKSTIKSYSSKGGGGFNEICFEDAKGQEQVFVHAEKDAHTRVKNDALQWIGRDQHAIVQRHQFEKIAGDAHLSVQGDQNEKVGGTVSLQAGMDLQEKVGMKYALDAGLEIHLKAGMNIVLEAGMSITLKAGGGFIVVGPTGVTISGMPVLINSGGAAGAGSGATPETPRPPLEADTAEPGRKAPLRDTAPVPFAEFVAQVQVLRNAAQAGMPFCEKCAEAQA